MIVPYFFSYSSLCTVVEHSPCHPRVKSSSSAAATDRKNDKEVVQITLGLYREYYRGKYHCSIDLLFDWFGSVCFANKNKNCQFFTYSWFQTSQTGGQLYCDTPPFSIFSWFIDSRKTRLVCTQVRGCYT
jgi:hypothetical protein